MIYSITYNVDESFDKYLKVIFTQKMDTNKCVEYKNKKHFLSYFLQLKC